MTAFIQGIVLAVSLVIVTSDRTTHPPWDRYMLAHAPKPIGFASSSSGALVAVRFALQSIQSPPTPIPLPIKYQTHVYSFALHRPPTGIYKPLIHLFLVTSVYAQIVIILSVFHLGFVKVWQRNNSHLKYLPFLQNCISKIEVIILDEFLSLQYQRWRILWCYICEFYKQCPLWILARKFSNFFSNVTIHLLNQIEYGNMIIHRKGFKAPRISKTSND